MDYTEWQAVDCDFVVRIDNFIITQLTAYRQKTSKQPESLGLLVGFVWENAFWVKAITTPHHLINSVVFSVYVHKNQLIIISNY